MIEILNYLKARYVGEKAQGIVEYALVLAVNCQAKCNTFEK